MESSDKVVKYIQKHTKWAPHLSTLRSVFARTGLIETIKWGVPTYTWEGKLVAGFAAFKNHYAIWFHQGVFLKDPADKLSNAQQGVTRAMRQWRFRAGDLPDPELIHRYLLEAIANCKAGKAVQPRRKKAPATLPEELKKALEEDSGLKSSFERLTPGRQRAYATYIAEAKMEATRQRRLGKILPMISAGIGLNDRYRK